MRLVLDYGGVLVDHVDEREYAHLLGVSPDQDPYPGWLAYFLFQAGFLNREEQYVDLLSTLTGATEAECYEYIDSTWLDPDFPEGRREVLAELAAEHSLVLFGNMVKPWTKRSFDATRCWSVSIRCSYRVNWNGRSHIPGGTTAVRRASTVRSSWLATSSTKTC